jgi:hypothetical protein
MSIDSRVTILTPLIDIIMEFAPVDVSRVRIGTIGPVADMFGLRFNNVFSIERSEMEGS